MLILFRYANGTIRTTGNNFYGQFWIESTGGINVASDLKGTPEINMEQIYAWDPDIIYITNFCPYLPEDLFENRIDGHDWGQLRAVQQKRVYKFPLGMYRWFPPASDTPLVFWWLTKHNQPELFADIDIKQKISSYYQQFYNITLTDQDLYAILHPVREAAGE